MHVETHFCRAEDLSLFGSAPTRSVTLAWRTGHPSITARWAWDVIACKGYFQAYTYTLEMRYGSPDGVSFIESFFREYSNSTPGFSSWYNTYKFFVTNCRSPADLFVLIDVDSNGANADADHNEKSFCCRSKSPNTLRGKEGEGTSRLRILVLSLVVECCSCIVRVLPSNSPLKWPTCSLKLLWVVNSPVAIEVVVPSLVPQSQVVVGSLHLQGC